MAKWDQITEERYNEMLEVLPPACWTSLGFLVGEPTDHDEHGKARYSAFIQLEGQFFAAKEPMTVADFKTYTITEKFRAWAASSKPTASLSV